MVEKSKILIIGRNGYVGKFIVEANAKSGHPTFALIRESTLSDPVKGKLIVGLKNAGVDLYDHERLVNAVKKVDVILPFTEFENNVDRARAVEPVKSINFAVKRQNLQSYKA
ncbi:Isoflavone reductase-like protein P3 [Forsythia ovata]|uniref:Isoflavone reductase-like protein P3 n=1 Tax=Forsythia ovata TaxID=205694 RepID=A0ABD1VLT5_9LAMI